MPAVRQIADEPRRRWFFSHRQDLVVWYDATDAIVGFQLAYDKYRRERAISWKAGLGYRHHAVDDGEQSPLRNDTPLLAQDGPFDHTQVLAEFREIAAELPRDIADFVENRLQQFAP